MAWGQFVWFDLMTTDREGAKRFYSDVVCWSTTKWSGGDYEMFGMGKDTSCGVMDLTPDQRKAGVPPNWLGYVSCENVDASVQRAQKLGGKIFVPGTDIPDIGRFAVLADPQGAAFAVFQPKSDGQAPDARAPGHFGWAELNTTDFKAAWRFYSELFGWKNTSTFDMGPEMGEYFMFQAMGSTDPQRAMGEMSNSAKALGFPPYWGHYINVKSVDAAVPKIKAAGGTVINGPMEVPGGDRILQARDPQGGSFALLSWKQ